MDGMNERAWQSLFDKYHIEDAVNRDGYFEITAEQIKEFREPRLMTKFDHAVNLPNIFADNNLSILPITRGSYLISTFEAYKEFQPSGNEIPRKVSIPHDVQSLAPEYIVSEAIALNCANACGILSEFLGEETLVPTVCGRMGSGAFDFMIDTDRGKMSVSVTNAQIEIDAAYEGYNGLYLFEAKRDLSKDFLVRQLYYPFRAWQHRVGKMVQPIFLIFSNGIFHLYQYQFDDPGAYGSISLVKQACYKITTGITRRDIERLADSAKTVQEAEIPFPQADMMERIVNLMELLGEHPMTRDEITSTYEFDGRQTSYYTQAGRYLGLLEQAGASSGRSVYQLSDTGRTIMQLSLTRRQLAIAKQILEHRAFNETLKIHLRDGREPDRETVVSIMKGAGLYHVGSDSTYERRASTVLKWVRWILNLIED